MVEEMFLRNSGSKKKCSQDTVVTIYQIGDYGVNIHRRENLNVHEALVLFPLEKYVEPAFRLLSRFVTFDSLYRC
jgi:hypothetical protein